MFTVLLLGIVLASIYVLLTPFLNASDVGSLKMLFASNGHQELEYQKDMLVNQIKDIEFDYRLGKLNEDDYSMLTREYKFKAASILKQMDTDAKPASQQETGQRPYCHECGVSTQPEANYCQDCGALLKGGNHENET